MGTAFKMGNCFGKCLSKNEDISNCNILSNNGTDITYPDNVTYCSTIGFNANLDSFGPSTSGAKKSFLSRLFKRELKTKKPVFQIVDDFLNNQGHGYSKLKEPVLPSVGSSTSNDIQLHCLDVRALLPHTNHSSPTTSIDLEWEHETIPFFMVQNRSENSCTNVSNDFTRCPSDCSFQSTVPTSHNSQPSSLHSLEWDSLCPASPPMSEIDTDTQLLIGEIERLTSQTLLETGHELLS